MHWWQLAPLAIAVLAVACVGLGARRLYENWTAQRDHAAHGARTTGRVVDVELEDSSFDDAQQVGFPVVHFVDRSGLAREFRNGEGFRPWPQIGTEYQLWYDPDDETTPPVLITPAPNLFAVVLVVMGVLGIALAAGMLYLASALR